MLDSRQGFGWFVAADPLRQTLGRLGTIEAQLSASGREPERRVLDFGFVKATKRVAAVLGADSVLRVRRLNLADGEPFARVTVWVPESLAGDLSRAAVARSSFYELLPLELGRAEQSIGAAACTESDAAVLEVPVGSPVLRCERTTWDRQRSGGAAGRARLSCVANRVPRRAAECRGRRVDRTVRPPPRRVGETGRHDWRCRSR